MLRDVVPRFFFGRGPRGGYCWASMRQPTDDLSEYHQQLLQTVAEHGVHIAYVQPADEGPTCFAYTVGLWHHHQQPEVLVFGLDPDGAAELLNALADECDDGRRFCGGERHEGLLVDYAVRFVDVPAERAAALCEGVTWAYEGEAVPVVQLVWPDKQGRWPWSDGIKKGFTEVQPVLGDREA